MAIAWCQATGVHAKMMEDVIYISLSLTSKLWKKNNKNKNISKIRTGMAPLSITHLIPPFIIMAIGLFLSTITFCVEKCRQKNTRSKKVPLNQHRQGLSRGRGQGGGGGGRGPNRGQAGEQGGNRGGGGRRPNGGRKVY